MENIDQAEVKKFSLRSDHWWAPKGPFRALHETNPVRTQFVTQHLKSTQATILDVGCGDGGLANYVALRHDISVFGADISIENVKPTALTSYKRAFILPRCPITQDRLKAVAKEKGLTITNDYEKADVIITHDEFFQRFGKL